MPWPSRAELPRREPPRGGDARTDRAATPGLAGWCAGRRSCEPLTEPRDDDVHQPLHVRRRLLAEVRLEVVPCPVDAGEPLVAGLAGLEDRCDVPAAVHLAIAGRVNAQRRLVD